jgi:hypothetical protein
VAAYSLHARHSTPLGVFLGACVAMLVADLAGFDFVTTVVLHLHVLGPCPASCAFGGLMVFAWVFALHALLA